jgi:hypothetical protein
MEACRGSSLVATPLCGGRVMSYELDLMVGQIRGNPFGPRREVIATKDGRIILLRTRDGMTTTEWEVPYTAVQQYWSFRFSGGEGGRAKRQVTLVRGDERFTVTLYAEDGDDLLRLLEQHAPHAERVRGLRRYRRPRSAAGWLQLAFTVAFFAVFAWQLLGHYL